MAKWTNINRIKKKEGGFTLIETLVALTVLIMALVGPLTLSQQGISASRSSQNQIIAFYLAQESMEYIINKRDSNILGGLGWLNGLDYCRTDLNIDGCLIDVLNNIIEVCSGECRKIQYNAATGYNHSSGNDTNFIRTVKITPVITNPDEVLVQVEIKWLVGSNTKSFTLQEHIFNL